MNAMTDERLREIKQAAYIARLQLIEARKTSKSLDSIEELLAEVERLRADAARLDAIDRLAWCDDGHFDRLIELCHTGTPIRKAIYAVESTMEAN